MFSARPPPLPSTPDRPASHPPKMISATEPKPVRIADKSGTAGSSRVVKVGGEGGW